MVRQRHKASVPTGDVQRVWSKKPTDDTASFIAKFEARDESLRHVLSHIDRLRLIHAVRLRDGRRAAVQYIHSQFEKWPKDVGYARESVDVFFGCVVCARKSVF
jgi:hypothetical protein